MCHFPCIIQPIEKLHTDNLLFEHYKSTLKTTKVLSKSQNKQLTFILVRTVKAPNRNNLQYQITSWHWSHNNDICENINFTSFYLFIACSFLYKRVLETSVEYVTNDNKILENINFHYQWAVHKRLQVTFIQFKASTRKSAFHEIFKLSIAAVRKFTAKLVCIERPIITICK